MNQNSKHKRSETIGNETFLTAPDFYHVPIKFAYMSKRPQSSYATRPSTKVSSGTNGTSPALGPGRYSVSMRTGTRGFQFSKSDRFDNADFFAKFSHIRKLTPCEKEKISKRIEKNKEYACLSKEQKSIIANKNIEKRRIRSEVARLASKTVAHAKVTQKIEKTKEKFRKFEFRLRLTEIGEIKKFWLVFASMFTVTTSLKYLIILKKQLKKRSGRYLKIFQYICKFLGKMHRIHIKLKYYKGLRVTFKQIIKIYLTKYVKLWLKQRRKRNLRILANTIELNLGSLAIKKLVLRWTDKLNIIKKIFRAALFYKVSLFQSLIHRWNKCEYIINGESPQTTKRVRKALSIHSIKDDKGNEGCLNIPIEIKIVYLKKYIRERILDYLKEYKIFRTHFKSVHRQNIKNRWLLENDIIVEYPIAPNKVNVYEEFDMDKIKIIVEEAMSEKATWKNIIFSDQGRISKLYQKRISLYQSSNHPLKNNT